jgi:hypothetical protein
MQGRECDVFTPTAANANANAIATVIAIAIAACVQLKERAALCRL